MEGSREAATPTIDEGDNDNIIQGRDASGEDRRHSEAELSANDKNDGNGEE